MPNPGETNDRTEHAKPSPIGAAVYRNVCRWWLVVALTIGAAVATAAAEMDVTHTVDLALKANLSARIAHEVNNPLGIISNYLHLCSRSMDDPKQAGEHLRVVKEELARIARIVRQLLDFHRPQRMEKIPIYLPDLIDEVLALVKWQLADNHIEVHRSFASELKMVIGSPEQLKQVLLNLIINARDFMPVAFILK